MPKLENGDNSAEYLQNFAKSKSGNLHHIPHCMSDSMILAKAVIQIFCGPGFQSRKREITQPYLYRALPKFNQVIYTLDTICMPKIMILAQAVLPVTLLIRSSG